jgi:DNA-binding SARP family transcriptional activator
MRVRALLALLLLRPNQVVSADALIDSLWEVAELPANPRSALQTYVSRLRSILGDERRTVVRSEEAGYLVHVGQDQLDLLGFRAAVAQALAVQGDPATRARLLTEGLSLWRGEPLTGVPAAPTVRDNVASLNEERLHATEQLIAARIELDQHGAVIGPLAALVHESPLRERPWALMIRALYRSGRQADALDAYQRVRAILRDQLGVEPGLELENLHQAILAGQDDRNAASRPKAAAPWSSVASRRAGPKSFWPPRQLPADVDRFTGRDEELAALDALLPREVPSDRRPTVIAAVDGMAGVGKTALAVRWANRVAALFPDGQLYADLRAHGPGRATDPVDATEVFLLSLGVPAAQIPGSLDGRSGLLRTMLADRCMLVLLDNARDADQVRPLLPGCGGFVLITSRRQLRGLAAREGASRLTVDPLVEPESVELMVRMLGRRARAEPDAVRALARFCGGLPQALAVAAERATREQGGTLAELVETLRAQPNRLDALHCDDDRLCDLRAVFASSYDTLPVEAARLFRVLATAPGPDLGAFAAAALAGVSNVHARRLLDQLVQTSMVRRTEPERFEIHDLLRAYASELAHHEAAVPRIADRASATTAVRQWRDSVPKERTATIP